MLGRDYPSARTSLERSRAALPDKDTIRLRLGLLAFLGVGVPFWTMVMLLTWWLL
jgi:hypothetical protein